MLALDACPVPPASFSPVHDPRSTAVHGLRTPCSPVAELYGT